MSTMVERWPGTSGQVLPDTIASEPQATKQIVESDPDDGQATDPSGCGCFGAAP